MLPRSTSSLLRKTCSNKQHRRRNASPPVRRDSGGYIFREFLTERVGPILLYVPFLLYLYLLHAVGGRIRIILITSESISLRVRKAGADLTKANTLSLERCRQIYHSLFDFLYVLFPLRQIKYCVCPRKISRGGGRGSYVLTPQHSIFLSFWGGLAMSERGVEGDVWLFAA